MVGGEQGFAGRDDAYAGEQVGGRCVFQQEPARACVQGFVHVLVQVEGGQDEDAYIGASVVGQDAAGRVEAVHDGHPDVHQDDVGLGADDEVDGRCSVGGAADDVEVGCSVEQHLESCADQGLVVDDRDANHCAARAVSIGSSTVSNEATAGHTVRPGPCR